MTLRIRVSSVTSVSPLFLHGLTHGLRTMPVTSVGRKHVLKGFPTYGLKEKEAGPVPTVVDI